MKKHLAITEIEIPEPKDESDEEGVDEPEELPELTPEMESDINRYLSSPPGQTLVTKWTAAVTGHN